MASSSPVAQTEKANIWSDVRASDSPKYLDIKPGECTQTQKPRKNFAKKKSGLNKSNDSQLFRQKKSPQQNLHTTLQNSVSNPSSSEDEHDPRDSSFSSSDTHDSSKVAESCSSTTARSKKPHTFKIGCKCGSCKLWNVCDIKPPEDLVYSDSQNKKEFICRSPGAMFKSENEEQYVRMYRQNEGEVLSKVLKAAKPKVLVHR